MNVLMYLKFTKEIAEVRQFSRRKKFPGIIALLIQKHKSAFTIRKTYMLILPPQTKPCFRCY